MILSPINLINFCLLLVTTIFMFVRSSWLGVWTIIEFNIFRFLPLILVSSISYEEEGVVKYFITQIIASILILWSYIIIIINLEINIIKFIMVTSLLIKIGSFPCYSWYPSVIKSINWFNCIILSTLQKTGPCLLLFIYLNTNMYILIFIRLSNVFIGGLFGLFQTDLRSLLAYSSISHVGWITASYSLRFKLISVIYFIFYLLLRIPIFLIFIVRGAYTLANIIYFNKDLLINMIIVFTMLLSLRGIPPLTGFIPKLITLLFIIKVSILFSILLVIISIFSIYIYLRILFSLLFFYFKQYFLKDILNYKLIITIIITIIYLPVIILIYAMTIFN